MDETDAGRGEAGQGRGARSTRSRRDRARADGRHADRLRALGLPLVLEPAVRRRDALRRAAPTAAMLTLVLVGIAAIDKATLILDSRPDDADDAVALSSGDPVIQLALLGSVLVLLSPVLAWLWSVVLRRLSHRAATAAGAVTAVALVVAPVVAFGRAGPPLHITLGCLAVVLAASYFGVGTMLRWSARRVVRELWTLGPMAARVLPILMLAFLFFFYNAEIWQVMVALSWERTWVVVAIMAIFTGVLVVMTTRDDLSSALTEQLSEADGDRHPRLRRSERVNLMLIPCVVALIQASLFALLVFSFFLFFGWLSVSPATAAQWTGKPDKSFQGLLAALPLSPTLVKVSMTLAAFSALNFAASTTSDQQHRSRFVEPMIDEVVDSLAVRNAYVRGSAMSHRDDAA